MRTANRETLEVHRRDIYSAALSDALTAFETISDKADCDDPIAVSFDVHFMPQKRTFASIFSGEFWKLSAGTMWATCVLSASAAQRQLMLDIQHELSTSVDTMTCMSDWLMVLQGMNTGTTAVKVYCTHVGAVWSAINISADYEDWLPFRYGALMSSRTLSSDAFALTELTAAINAARLADAFWGVNGMKQGDPAAEPILERARRSCALRLAS